MSSQASRQSPFEKAKAEMDRLSQNFQRDLDNVRTAPIMEYATRMSSLENTFQASQRSAMASVEKASSASDQRIDDLENNLRAEKALLKDAHKNLQAEKERTDRLMKRILAETEAAKAQHADMKAQHADMKAELDTKRKESEDARAGLQKAKVELEDAKRAPANLQKDLETVKQQNIDLGKESAAAELDRKQLLDELTTVRQHEAHLQAELESIKQGFDTFRSGFNQFNHHMTALSCSTMQHPTQARTASASFLPDHRQSRVDEMNGGPQRKNQSVQSQALGPQAAEYMNYKEPDLLFCQNVLEEVMDQKHWQHNRHFFKPVDSTISDFRPHLDASTQPMSLNTMKDKLAKGAYNSANSFKTDFDIMIANCRNVSPVDSQIQIAGEKLLAIFEEQWSAPGASDHGSRGQNSHDQLSRGQKRKASTERPVQSEGGPEAARRTRSASVLNNNAAQPSGNPAVESLAARQTQSLQPPDTSGSSAETEPGVWEGQVIVGPNVQVDAKVNVVVKQVSVVKPVKTFDASLKEVFPDKLEVQGHVTTGWLEEELHRLNFTSDLDMVTFRIEPASDADNADFNRLFNYFIRRERYGTVSHAGGCNVNKVHLIPVPAGSQCPQYISSPDYKALPVHPKENFLLLVVVCQINETVQEQIRLARDAAIKAVRSPNMKDLADARSHFRHHPLPIFHPCDFVVHGSKRFLPMLNKILTSRTPAGPKIAAYPSGFHCLSYPSLAKSGESSIDGVELPKCIFVLGRVISPTTRWGLLVVDMEHDDRPLWGIMRNKTEESRLGKVMMLMSNKFPSSLAEWESTITMDHQNNQLKKRLHLTGLKIERYRSSS